jgi:hypothetical protein
MTDGELAWSINIPPVQKYTHIRPAFALGDLYICNQGLFESVLDRKVIKSEQGETCRPMLHHTHRIEKL